MASGAIETAHALPWPLDDAVGPFRIGGVLGEYRDTGATDHFHDGVDVSTTAGANVRASLAGTLNAFCNTCGVDNYIEVKTGTSRYIYYHVDPTVTTLNTPITLGQLIGNVHNQTGPHVHLEQLDGLAQDVNTLLNPGFANYVDTSSPSVSGVGFYDANTGPDAAAIDISSPTTKDYLRIRAKEFDRQSLGSQNVGIFSTGYKVFNNATNALVIDNSIQQSYASFAENVTNSPQIAYDSTTSTTNDYYYFANNWITMAQPLNLQNYPDASYKICVVAKDMKGNGGNTVTQVGAECKTYRLDRTAPTEGLLDGNGASLYNGGASSMTTITVTSTDTFGMKQIAISGPTSDSRNVTGLTATETFTGLTDGQYTATVTDLAGNSASNSFKVSVGPPTSHIKDSYDKTTRALTSTECFKAELSDAVAGICSITIGGPPGFNTRSYSFSAATEAVLGPFCQVPVGTYTVTGAGCSGVADVSTVSYVDAGSAGRLQIDADGPGGPREGHANLSQYTNLLDPELRLEVTVRTPGDINMTNTICMRIHSTIGGQKGYCRHTINGIISERLDMIPETVSFTVENTTDTGHDQNITIEAALYKGGFFQQADVTFPFDSTNKFTGSITGTVSLPQVGQPFPADSPDGVAHSTPTIRNVSVAKCTPANSIFQQLIAQLLVWTFPAHNPYCWAGSEAVFTSSVPMSFAFQAATGVTIDTTTLGIYGYDAPSGQWTRNMATDQSVRISSTGYIVASGSFTRTGAYGVFFVGHDSSAPVTTFAIQGASYAFDGAIFVSTDAYAVLIATDPAVNGFASTVASVTYRLDPSSGMPFSVYASSIPLPLGTHVFEYRSLDYAGNAETVKTATFTVTAGTAFRNSSTQQVGGNLLNGFLGSGAKLEIESQAQNSLTLLVSSVNRQGMVAVHNIGEVGIGVTPQANLDIGAALIALQLRSGNSTSSVTSAQIAFGYNGDASDRHFIRTEHSTSTDGNKMDFLVWNPSAGSTTTLASLNALSLQGIATASGGSFHVHPAGEPDAEVEVSNGLTTGGGTIQYGELLTPSSRRFKTDIKDLSESDEARALADVAALKHVRFRYRTDDPKLPPHTGLIYEEVPESLRGAEGTLSTVERLANVEMALKAAMLRLEKLQKRYSELKKGGKQ